MIDKERQTYLTMIQLAQGPLQLDSAARAT